MTQERLTRRISQPEEEKLFAELQASSEFDKRLKTPEQKRGQLDKRPGAGKPFIGGASSEVDGTNSVADSVFAGA